MYVYADSWSDKFSHALIDYWSNGDEFGIFIQDNLPQLLEDNTKMWQIDCQANKFPDLVEADWGGTYTETGLYVNDFTYREVTDDNPINSIVNLYVPRKILRI